MDVADLDTTLQGHASLRAWINAAYESANIETERWKWEVTKARALALLAARREPDPYTGKAKTVDVVSAETDAAPEVQDATNALLDAQEKRGALKAMASALEDRVQMLIQISANTRKEKIDQNR